MTRRVIARWLENDRYRHLGDIVQGTENPEYRIAVDIRAATDAPIDLSLAFVSSLLTAMTFFGVLWSVGGSLTLQIFGRSVTFPGYLVLGVIVYSGAVSMLMILVGHRMTSVIEHMNQSEAEFRASVDAFHLDAGSDEPGPNDDEKRSTMLLRLTVVVVWWRALCGQLMRTTSISHGNLLLAPVVGWLLCVPKYLSGAMTLGEVTQSAAAFVTVQGAFNWLVDNYQRLADWRSSVHRVGSLLFALDQLEAKETASPKTAGPETSDQEIATGQPPPDSATGKPPPSQS
ncbi:MAG: ABC transporter [Alphaproteobacteria bacterium]|nr:ABC transporter [Alphaproteobacteria bacterium]